MHELVEELDRLMDQERRDRGVAPLLVLHEPEGNAGRRILRSLRDRLRSPEAVVPHAYVMAGRGNSSRPRGRNRGRNRGGDSTANSTDLALHEDITGQLMESMPPDTGRLRLPRYDLLHAVFTAPVVGGEPRERRKALLDHCFAQQRERSRGLGWLWSQPGQVQLAGSIGLLWRLMDNQLLRSLPRWLYARRAHRRMMGRAGAERWFGEWLQLQGGKYGNFFSAVLRITPNGALSPEKLDQVLLRALLYDLEDAAHHWRRVSPWRRRRTGRFVLFIEEAGTTDSREQRFLRELAEAAERTQCTSVLTLAAGVRSLGHHRPHEHVPDIPSTAQRLRLVRESGGSRAVTLVLAVPQEEPADDRARYALGQIPIMQRRQHFSSGPRGAVTVAVLVSLALLAVAGLSASWVFSRGSDSCEGSTFVSRKGHCVGVQKAELWKEKNVREVLKQLEEQNAHVMEETAGWTADGGRPRPRTVVYMGPLSGGKNAEDPVRGGTLPELRGIALAQQEINDHALESRENVPLRVLVADTGPFFLGAPDVARHIVELADRDPSIIGVVGMGQSRGTTYQAIRTLGAAGIPVIGTSGTSDELLEQGKHYYQIAPTDSRAGAAMAAFVSKAEMVHLASEETAVASRVRLVADRTDSYSNSLATAFMNAYEARDGDVEVLWHTPATNTNRDDIPGPTTGTVVKGLSDLAREVCTAVQKNDKTAVVWAARASALPVFLTELQKRSRDCPRLGLLGGDDVTNALIHGTKLWEKYPGLTLYHLAHGSRTHQRENPEENPEGEKFTEAYTKEYERSGDKEADALVEDPHPALAWDALSYLSEAVDQAWEATDHSDDRLGRTLVQGVLYQGLADGGHQGATGWINAPGVDGQQLTPEKLLFVLHAKEQGSSLEPVLICGAVNGDTVHKTWGDGKQHDCPAPSGS